MPFDTLTEARYKEEIDIFIPEKNAIKVLVNVRNYLSNKNHWIKEQFSVGDKVCIYGALSKFSGYGNSVFLPYSEIPEIGERYNSYAKATFYVQDAIKFFREKRSFYKGIYKHCAISDFNDDYRTKHKDVLKVLDKAIELSKEGNV